MPSLFAFALFWASLPAGDAGQDIQTSNDWATGSAHAAVVDSINRNSIARTRARRAGASPARRWTAAERARNCRFLRGHLRQLNARQLHSYRMVCR